MEIGPWQQVCSWLFFLLELLLILYLSGSCGVWMTKYWADLRKLGMKWLGSWYQWFQTFGYWLAVAKVLS